MKERVPGVGGSIGLDRLIAALEQLELLPQSLSYIDAEIYCQNAADAVYYQRAAAELRNRGVCVEVFPEAKKMAQQYAVTSAKNIAWGILISSDDVKNNTLSLKNLSTREVLSGIDFDTASKTIIESKKSLKR